MMASMKGKHMSSTYAFKSVVGAFTDPDAGTFPFRGQEGVKQLTVYNATDRTIHDTAADGTVMVSYVSGQSGALEIETQQQSSLHEFLVNWANIKFTQCEASNASNFASAAIKVQDLLSGAVHTLTGVSPLKIPDKGYGASGAMVTWRLLAAQVTTQ
jgi:hypothetical protein